MASDSSVFNDLDQSFTSKVKIGNGKYIEARGRGSVFVQTSSGIKLIPDVLYVPEIDQNLLSVGQLLEKNYYLVFKDKKCVVYDSAGSELVCIKMVNKSFFFELECL